MEGVILIPKRMVSGRGVNVFSRFGGGEIKIIVRFFDATITGRGLGSELLNFLEFTYG
jgi:hypothetical protein